MDKILKGILKYRHTFRHGMVEQFQQVKDNPVPKAIFFTCMDSRMLPTRFTYTNVGDMFIVRNAGNLVPHAKLYDTETVSTEPAALELGCIVNGIKNVIVCGHSDCKAMNLLYDLRDPALATPEKLHMSPLSAWVCRHGSNSLTKLMQLEVSGFDKPLVFEGELPMRRFVAYIDPENQFSVTDKLSQVNTLQQLQNISSYGMLKRGLTRGEIHIHALWFDIYTGNIHYFSRQQKRFVDLNEDTLPEISEEVRKYYASGH